MRQAIRQKRCESMLMGWIQNRRPERTHLLYYVLEGYRNLNKLLNIRMI